MRRLRPPRGSRLLTTLEQEKESLQDEAARIHSNGHCHFHPFEGVDSGKTDGQRLISKAALQRPDFADIFT